MSLRRAAFPGGPPILFGRVTPTGYQAVHAYLRDHYSKTGVCDECGNQPDRPTEFALIHGRQYSRNREDYRELCHRCHMRYDGIAGKQSAETIEKVRLKIQGSKHYAAKLTEADVVRMRQERAKGRLLTDLAEEFGVSFGTVAPIVKGEHWKHVPMASGVPPKTHARGERVNTAKLTEAQVIQIRRLHAQGNRSYVSLGREFGVSDYAITCIVRRKSWAHVEDPAEAKPGEQASLF